MKLIEQMIQDWAAGKKIRMAPVMHDQWGELSRLDRLDGLRNRD